MKNFAIRLITIIFLLFIFQTCNEPFDQVGDPLFDFPQGIEIAMEKVQDVIDLQEKVSNAFFMNPEVVGHGISLDENDNSVIVVFTLSKLEHRSDKSYENIGKGKNPDALPTEIENVKVISEVTGKFVAYADPTARFDRPVPIGISTGHPDITAGTIGCRVTNGSNVYALSNNHVYANENLAKVGDDLIQPGTYDGGSLPNDFIGTLSDFEPINFSGNNQIDAAISNVTTSALGVSTPAGAGYGTPSSTTVAAKIRMKVQKYGRTTGLTNGRVSALNATINVGYDGGVARFVNQIVISPGRFSAGGDSGSLIVTNNDSKNPVGLLFAGSAVYTIANPIDVVLNRFNVTIDDGGGSVTPGNTPPSANFTYTTSLLTAYFTDASTDTDTDGTVQGWSWNFGDDSNTSNEQSPSHTYTDNGTYNVTLTVTDNDGDTDSATKSITVSDGTGNITLITSVRTKGANKVTLTWTGATGAFVEIFRDNAPIGVFENTGSYTDVLAKAVGTFTYRICETDGSVCSIDLDAVVSE